MLTPKGTRSRPGRNLRAERRLWSDRARHTGSIGCLSCPDRDLCGGLQPSASLYSCLSLCCGKPEECDAVCRRKPTEFAARVREVGGFSLDNVPRTPVVARPPLPALAPMFFHGKTRRSAFRGSAAVCLSLHQVIHRQDGTPRYADRTALANAFKIADGTSLILSGTAHDQPLERW